MEGLLSTGLTPPSFLKDSNLTPISPTLTHMKRTRARVTLGGQCVHLQNSLKIKLFDFFLKPKLPDKSHLSRHTSKPMKKCKNIRNQAVKQQKCPKMDFKKMVKCMM